MFLWKLFFWLASNGFPNIFGISKLTSASRARVEKFKLMNWLQGFSNKKILNVDYKNYRKLHNFTAELHKIAFIYWFGVITVCYNLNNSQSSSPISQREFQKISQIHKFTEFLKFQKYSRNSKVAQNYRETHRKYTAAMKTWIIVLFWEFTRLHYSDGLAKYYKVKNLNKLSSWNKLGIKCKRVLWTNKLNLQKNNTDGREKIIWFFFFQQFNNSTKIVYKSIKSWRFVCDFQVCTYIHRYW